VQDFFHPQYYQKVYPTAHFTKSSPATGRRASRPSSASPGALLASASCWRGDTRARRSAEGSGPRLKPPWKNGWKMEKNGAFIIFIDEEC